MRLLLGMLFLAAIASRSLALEVGDPAPDFTLTGVEGSTHSLAELKAGKALLLDFGSVFCANCQNMLSLLADIGQECEGGALRVAAINIDPPNSAKAVKAAILGLNPGYPVLLDGEGVVAASYGVAQIPHLVLIGPDGIVRAVHTGPPPDLGKMLHGLCTPSGKEE